MLKSLLTLALLSSLVFNTSAQDNSEVYLLDIEESEGLIKLKNPLNISKREGYDNQPFFHPQKPILYYSSRINGQTDIFSYNYSTAYTRQITFTTDYEYSPNVIPGNLYLSCIVQREKTGYQDLVKYNLNNPLKSRLILKSKDIGRVGYQTWLSNTTFLAFILGSPHKLHYFDLKNNTNKVVADNIGRSLQIIPNKNRASFVQGENKQFFIKSFDPKTKAIETIAESDSTSEHFHVWTSKGMLLESVNQGIKYFEPSEKVWKELALPANMPKAKISRMAIHGNKMAVVVDE